MADLLVHRAVVAPATAKPWCCRTSRCRCAEGQSLALARPQRHGQDHAGQLHRRGHALSRRHDPARRPRHHPAASRPARPCRHRLGAAGAQYLQIAHRRGKSHGGGAARALDADKVYALFPRLAERRQNLGNQLSGGEQQMLAVGRALVLNPRIMLLDEPLEGLAPIIVEELLAALRRIIREEGTLGHPGRAERQENSWRHRSRHHPRTRQRRA